MPSHSHRFGSSALLKAAILVGVWLVIHYAITYVDVATHPSINGDAYGHIALADSAESPTSATNGLTVARGAITYTQVTDMPDEWVSILGFNNNNVVVGVCQDGDLCLWRPGQPAFLHYPDDVYDWIQPESINDHSIVVGSLRKDQESTWLRQGFVWSEDSGYQVVSSPFGGQENYFIGNNNHGHVFGISKSGPYPYGYQPYLMTSETILDLNNYGFPDLSSILLHLNNALSNQDRIVYWHEPGFFIWQVGQILATFPPATQLVTQNEIGQVLLADCGVWQDGVITRIASPRYILDSPGLCWSKDLNDSTQVLGVVEVVVDDQSNFKWFIWNNGVAYVLGDFINPAYGYELGYSYFINDLGYTIAMNSPNSRHVLIHPIEFPDPPADYTFLSEPASVSRGDVITYTIEVTNALGAMICDTQTTIPTGTQVITESVEPLQGLSVEGNRVMCIECLANKFGGWKAQFGVFVTDEAVGPLQSTTEFRLGEYQYSIATTTQLEAQSTIVNSAADTPDEDPGDGVCDTGITLTEGMQECTLRAAMQQANAEPGIDVIRFNIPGVNPPTIHLQQTLPIINEAVVIDGTSQTGGRVILDGSGTGSGSWGMYTSASGTTLKGLTIQSFPGYGIWSTASDLNLYNVQLLSNGNDGVYAPHGHVNMTGNVKANNNNQVTCSEDSAGVYARSVEAEQLEATGNCGNGLRAYSLSGDDGGGTASIGPANVSNNAGNGIWASHDLTITGDIVINGNAGYGIYGDQDVTLTGATGELSNNDRQGIYAPNGTAKITGSVSANNNNQDDTQCGNDSAGITAWTIEGGDLEASNNCGQGLKSLDGSIAADRVTTNNNTGYGIQSFWNVVIGSNDNESSMNGRNGIYAPFGNVLIAGNALVNGNNRSICEVGIDAAIYAREVSTADIIVEGNCGLGIHSTDGSTELGNATITNNTGVGILSATNVILNGSNNDISNNGFDGIRAFNGYVLVHGNIKVNGNNKLDAHCTWDGSAGIVARSIKADHLEAQNNCGYGINAWNVEGYALVYLSSATVTGNTRAGIAADYDVIIKGAEASRISYNGADGISAWNGIVSMRNGEVCSNQGYGIYAGRKIDLAQVRVCDNQLGGTYPSMGGLAYRATLANDSTEITTAAAADSSVLQGCEITGNLGDGVLIAGGADFSIRESNILNNGGYGANNQMPFTVDAQHNWWGNASGPVYGVDYSGDVDVTNWHTAPIALVVSPNTNPVIAASGITTSTLLHIRNWQWLTDTVTVSLSDTQGWLLEPLTRTVELTDGIGVSIPVSYSVPPAAQLGTVDTVYVSAVSGNDPTDVATTTVEIVVNGVADLSVMVQSASNSIGVGDVANLTLDISNEGPSIASGVRVTTTLPNHVLYTGLESPDAYCTVDANAVVCDLDTLNDASTATVTLTATAIQPGTAPIHAMVSGNEYDPELFNNQSYASVNVAGTKLYLPCMLKLSSR